MSAERWAAVAVSSEGRRTLSDRSALVVSLCFYAMVSTILATLWRTAAAGHGGEVAGYTGRELTWYIAMSEACTVTLNIRMIELIGQDIASGGIAVELLRPAPVLWLRALGELGRALPRMVACALLGGALSWLTAGPPPHAGTWLLALPAMLLGVSVNLMAQHAFAAIAFWIRDARSTWFLYQKLVFMVGGMLLPLQILPHALRTVAFGLPFMAMAYVPARLASGHFEPALLLVQAGWLVVMAAAANAVWNLGQRRLQVVGG